VWSLDALASSPNGMAARAEAELASPAPWRRGGDPAPGSAVECASQDRGLGGAGRVDRVAAQEGSVARQQPVATEVRGFSDLAGGAERDGVAAQVNERVDGVAAQEVSVARQQPVKTLMVEGVQSTGRTVLRASQVRRNAGSGRRAAPRAHSPSAPSEEGVPEEKSLLDGARMARGRCVEGVARGARGGAWRARRGGRNRRGERDRRGGGGALARHA
jgi:hypothetical protein